MIRVKSPYSLMGEKVSFRGKDAVKLSGKKEKQQKPEAQEPALEWSARWEPGMRLAKEVSNENRLAAQCGIQNWSEAFQKAGDMKRAILEFREEASEAQANAPMQCVLQLLS